MLEAGEVMVFNVTCGHGNSDSHLAARAGDGVRRNPLKGLAGQVTGRDPGLLEKGSLALRKQKTWCEPKQRSPGSSQILPLIKIIEIIFK